MVREQQKMDFYVNRNPIKHPGIRTETRRHQSPQNTGSDSVKMRRSRGAAVCLALLCFLLLTAVIVLCVHVYAKNTNYTHERNQLLTRINNITEERDELLTKNILLAKEKDELSSNYSDLVQQQEQFNQQKIELLKKDEWISGQSSLYFISSERKNWTESRRHCQERGADLIIIKNREEQEFVEKLEFVWIGLTDIDEEGRWKWVDGSVLTTWFWDPREPNGGRGENCALRYSAGWADYPCSDPFKWICEK